MSHKKNGVYKFFQEQLEHIQLQREADQREHKQDMSDIRREIKDLGSSIFSKMESLVNATRPDKDLLWKIIGGLTPIIVLGSTLIYFAINNSVKPVSMMSQHAEVHIDRLESELKESEAKVTRLLEDNATNKEKLKWLEKIK